VLGIESRGFIIGAPVAYRLGVGLTIARKPGKLPFHTIGETYDLEYGSDALEMHQDAVTRGERVLIVDDLIATGGTARATARLVESQGATVAGLGFIVELTFLPGRAALSDYEVASLIQY